MPESDHEPEMYSYDEMVSRAKRRSVDGDDGEWVTREDGSQLLRVRRRKRRTNQTARKEPKRILNSQVIQIALFAVLLMSVFLVCIFALVYSNSTRYRNVLTKQAEAASGSKVEMQQFRINPVTANLAKLVMSWPGGNVLEKLAVDSPVANVAPLSFFGRSFRGEEIVAPKGELVLRSPLKGESVTYGSGGGDGNPIVFARYSVTELDVFFGSDRSTNHMLGKTQASFYPSTGNRKTEIRFVGGTFNYGDWPELELDRSYIRRIEDKIYIESFRFKVPTAIKLPEENSGTIDFSAELKPLDTDAAFTLAAKVDSFPLSYILGENLGGLLSGLMRTDERKNDTNYLKFHPNTPQDAELALGLVGESDSKLTISRFRFLSQLAIHLKTPWYEMPLFDTRVAMSLKRVGKFVEVSDIFIEEENRLVIRGDLRTLDAGKISGKLRVGLPSNLITISKNKRLARLFSKPEEGYSWIDLEVGGTSASPEDNFKEMYDAANEDVEFKEVKTTVQQYKPLEEPYEIKPPEEVDDFDRLIEGK